MQRKFTIKVTEENGKETVAVYYSKAEAIAISRALGARPERLTVEFTVECGDTRQSETIIKEAQSVSLVH